MTAPSDYPPAANPGHVEPAPAFRDPAGVDPSPAPASGPSDQARYAMFVVLIVVMASAPTWVAYRAIREGRSVDFPLGGSLGDSAVLLFALAAIALLSVCFWPSLNAAAWTTPTNGTLIGASGVAMAFLGGTHAVAGLIGTGFLSEPAWLAWIVLIAVYPIAGQLALRLVKDFIGPGALDRATGAPVEADPDDDFWSREQSPFTGARTFGAAEDVDPGSTPPVDLASAASRAIDEPINPNTPLPDAAAEPVDGDSFFTAGPMAGSSKRQAADPGPAPEVEPFDDDPFAEPGATSASQPTTSNDGAYPDAGTYDEAPHAGETHYAGETYDDGDWDDDDEYWDDDPFA